MNLYNFILTALRLSCRRNAKSTLELSFPSHLKAAKPIIWQPSENHYEIIVHLQKK